jgi:hypothetical protein
MVSPSMVALTNEERVAAAESMFRIRAVESPPSVAGLRTVWHRGLKGAQLVSEIDDDGHVTRQELWLHDEVMVWVAGVFRTGAGSPDGKTPKPPESVRWDERPSRERLDRFAAALGKYQGSDRIIRHVRDVLGVTEKPPVVEVRQRRTPVARRDPALDEAQRREALRQANRRRTLGTMILAAGALLCALGVLLLWRSMGS